MNETEPSATRITRDNYQPTLAMLWAQANLIAEAPIPEMLAAAERADSIGAILDPTLFREKGRALQEDITMLEALRHVQVVIERLRQRKAGT